MSTEQAGPFDVGPAQPEDIEVIADFNQAMALETENKMLDRPTLLSGVQAVFDRNDLGFYLVARNAGDASDGDDGGEKKVAGCLLITTEWSDWRNGLFWWIQSVYVDPAFRGQGVFSALYAHVRQAARARPDICGLRLYVEKENERARRTYLRLGMIETNYRMLEEEFPPR